MEWKLKPLELTVCFFISAQMSLDLLMLFEPTGVYWEPGLGKCCVFLLGLEQVCEWLWWAVVLGNRVLVSILYVQLTCCLSHWEASPDRPILWVLSLPCSPMWVSYARLVPGEGSELLGQSVLAAPSSAGLSQSKVFRSRFFSFMLPWGNVGVVLTSLVLVP